MRLAERHLREALGACRDAPHQCERYALERPVRPQQCLYPRRVTAHRARSEQRVGRPEQLGPTRAEFGSYATQEHQTKGVAARTPLQQRAQRVPRCEPALRGGAAERGEGGGVGRRRLARRASDGRAQ